MSCSGAPDLLSLLKHPEEGGHRTKVKSMCGDSHDVVHDASQLSIQNYKQNPEYTKPFECEMMSPKINKNELVMVFH